MSVVLIAFNYPSEDSTFLIIYLYLTATHTLKEFRRGVRPWESLDTLCTCSGVNKKVPRILYSELVLVYPFSLVHVLGQLANAQGLTQTSRSGLPSFRRLDCTTKRFGYIIQCDTGVNKNILR